MGAPQPHLQRRPWWGFLGVVISFPRGGSGGGRGGGAALARELDQELGECGWGAPALLGGCALAECPVGEAHASAVGHPVRRLTRRKARVRAWAGAHHVEP